MKFVLVILVNAMIFESMDARHKRAVFDIIPIYERNKVFIIRFIQVRFKLAQPFITWFLTSKLNSQQKVV